MMNLSLMRRYVRPKKIPVSRSRWQVLLLLPMLLVCSDLQAQQEKHVGHSTDSAELVSNLTLTKILSLALTGNPELEAFSWDVRASDAQLLQAKLLPNPRFNFELENFGGSDEFSGTDVAESTYLLSQLIELGGKRTARTEMATRIRDSKKSDYEIQRIKVLSDATNKFYHVAADQERLNLARQATQLALTAKRNIENRVRAGKSSTVEAKKAEVLLSQFRVEEEHTEHELASAKLRLAATWGAEKVLFKSVDAKLYRRESMPEYHILVTDLDNTPGVQRWLLEEQVQDAQLELEKANRIPDITLGVGLRRFEDADSNAAVAQFSIPLPIFDRNQHQVSKAESLKRKAEAKKRSFRTKLNERIFSVYQELGHSALEMKESEERILPAASAAFKSAKDGFQRGRFSYLELTDTQRIFLEAKKTYIKSALEYQEGITELEKLTGISIRKINAHSKLEEELDENE